MPQIDRLASVVFRMILNSFNYNNDTERNITRKIRKSSYKKYRVHRCSGNIGIITCKTAKWITIVERLYQAV
jgi:hypothetical protein